MTPDYWTAYARRQLALEAAYDLMGWMLLWGVVLGGVYLVASWGRR